MFGFRKVLPLENVTIRGNNPGPVPEVKFLSPEQLVINEEYQRDLSGTSILQIKKMATNFDWRSYKAITVAPTDEPGIYEVVDGQHTAIAAATNGNVPFLPAILMDAKTLEDKAGGFLGINRNRIALTPAAIYAAEVAAKDELAVCVEEALQETGAVILPLPKPKGKWKVGETIAIGAMKEIVRQYDQKRLVRVINILMEAQAAPITACLLKGVNLALPPYEMSDVDNRVMTVIHTQTPARLEIIAAGRKVGKDQKFQTLADMLADMARIPGKRLGHKTKNK